MSDPIATYTFLPWLRQGIASNITQPDNLGADAGPAERASVRLSLQVNSDPHFASSNIQLVGPGDVVGINPRAIVRTEPRNWITDFEPNFLAFIEFYEEDFAWRYTPAIAVELDDSGNTVSDPQRTKLRPWIFLLVLEEGEFDPGVSLNGLLPVVKLKEGINPEDIFPPSDQAWAWAHVQVSQDIIESNTQTIGETVDALESLVRQNSDKAFCRLLSPRKLKPQATYHACVIPAFEVGRQAGLGLSTSADGSPTALGNLTPSWGNGQTEYPVYYQWYFRTGERGDFEYLAQLLEPREVDARVGIRDMDMQNPNFGVAGMTDGPGDLPIMGLEGALKSLKAKPRPETWPPAAHPAFLNELASTINFQDTLLNPPDSDIGHPDPVISPPLYGRWHAMQSRLNVGQTGWVNELNRDPRYRVPAGFGTQVIQANQETYMQKAWQQLGDVLRANQKIRQAQLAIATSHSLFVRHLHPLTSDQQAAITAQLHNRVLGSPTTISQQVKKSRLPQAALTPTFRRVLRPRGAVMRKAVPNSKRKPNDVLHQLNEGRITAAAPKAAPDKQISLDKVADALRPSWLPDWLHTALLGGYVRWGLLVLLVLTVASFVVAGFSAGLSAIAVLLVGAAASAERLAGRLQAAQRFGEKNLTTAAVNEIPPRRAFVITEPGQPLPSGIKSTGSSDSPEAANFRTALLDLHARLETPLPTTEIKTKLDFRNTSHKLLAALNPVNAIPRRIRSYLAISEDYNYLRPSVDDSSSDDPAPPLTLDLIMAHPVFSDAMYKPLRDISSELLVPNLNLIPNNTISLLETNPKFIEAYMVGVNHEMASELLWKKYPTDQRGTFFRQFWDVSGVINRDEGKDAKTLEEELRDIKPLHNWREPADLGTQLTALGKNGNRILPTGESKLVLVVRGDLLKKYPTIILFAQKAKWTDDEEGRKIRKLDESDPAVNIQCPIFKAAIEPDVRFAGFDLTVSEAKGDPTPPTEDTAVGTPGWFFVLQQTPGEPRFGLDIETNTPPMPEAWNQLAWNHLGDPETIKFIDLSVVPTPEIIDTDTDSPEKKIIWGTNAADMAYILHQDPVMVAIHADDMLE